MMSKIRKWPESALAGVHFEGKYFHLELVDRFAFDTKHPLGYKFTRNNKSNEKARTFSSGR